MEQTKSISAFLDEDYLEYAQYVVENRAIPSIIDGFKPTQRKVIAAATKVWKSGNEKPMKVAALTGRLMADLHYHHGDSSGSGAIVTMAQKFKNSMPLLDEIGQFGSLRSPAPGAPRYISTKLNKNFKAIYKDFELIERQYEEGDEIEPKFFLPIIPTVLLNGSSGIAVGFATNILNRNPKTLIDCCLKVLDGKKFKEPSPWINEFNGIWVQDAINNLSWTAKGSYQILNTTDVHITELPPGITYDKFENHLSSLEERGWIQSYEDNCRSNIDYKLKFTRKMLAEKKDLFHIGSWFKMEERQTENLTMLDEHGKLLVFKNITDVIKYFVEFRLTYYDKRKAYIINKLENQLAKLSNRAAFIKAIIEGKLKVNNVPKKNIILWLGTADFDEYEGSYQYLLSMPIYTLTKEKYEELLKEIKTIKADLKIILGTKPKDMYIDDLNELKTSLK